MFEYNTNVRIEIYRIIELFYLYGLTGHLIACAFGLIGKFEYGRGSRFDGMTLFSYVETRPWQAGITDDIMALSKWELYTLMLYLGIGVQGLCPYGDLVPWAPIEEVFGILT